VLSSPPPSDRTSRKLFLDPDIIPRRPPSPPLWWVTDQACGITLGPTKSPGLSSRPPPPRPGENWWLMDAVARAARYSFNWTTRDRPLVAGQEPSLKDRLHSPTSRPDFSTDTTRPTFPYNCQSVSGRARHTCTTESCNVSANAHLPSRCWSNRSPGQTFPGVLSDFQHLAATNSSDQRLCVHFF